MAWRLAKSLEQLRKQVNELAPNRSKRDDGSIGDERHQSRSSDHNPWIRDGEVGVVSAIDLTHDPAGGFDSYKFADMLKANRDQRIKYVISNSRIWNPALASGWRSYHGTNPHDRHVHISVLSSKSRYDDVTPWKLSLPAVVTPSPAHGEIGIIATVFGGAEDNERSGYDGQPLDNHSLYVALPYRFDEPPSVKVTNAKTGESAVGKVRDIGPWVTDDDYWESKTRPLAEVSFKTRKPLPRGPNKGRIANGAGIDLSPALAKAIGIKDGKGLVNWEFA